MNAVQKFEKIKRHLSVVSKFMSSKTIFKKCPTERNRGEKIVRLDVISLFFSANCPTGNK